MGLMAGPALAARTETGLISATFTAWMASEQRRVFGLCQRLLRDADEADSATQDVFLKAYTALCARRTPRPWTIRRAGLPGSRSTPAWTGCARSAGVSGAGVRPSRMKR